MGANSNLSRDCQPGVVEITVVGLGANGADLTIQEGGQEVSAIARQGEGVYRFKFKTKRPYLIGLTGVAFKATTPGDLKGYSAVAEAIVTTGDPYYVDVTVYGDGGAGAPAPADLIAAQWGVFTFKFRETALK